MNYVAKICFISLLSLGYQVAVCAEAVDQELATSLKIEANHNLTRLKSLDGERKNKKIYDTEREKGLGSFLEEQEKWDLTRERGLAEYRKQKKQISPKENGPEHQADIKAKEKYAAQIEKSRQVQVRTRNQIVSSNQGLINRLETEEFSLNQERPRYDLRKRGQNRWVKNTSSAAKSGNSAPGYSPPPPTTFDDFPPPSPDYIPQPMENFEEIPPPPPPIYESYGQPGGYDAGFGDIPPPPPPPPMDYDF